MNLSMDRKALKLPFTLNGPKNWVCPTCQSGMLGIKIDSFNKNEIRKSRNHSYEAWDPEWIQFTFSCLLDCTNAHCKETVSCTGVGSVEENYFTDEDGNPRSRYEEYYTPKYFEPHLRLIEVPKVCPESVSTLLDESFKLFFCSPSAASNNVRMALEELLTALKVRLSKETETVHQLARADNLTANTLCPAEGTYSCNQMAR